MGRAAPKIFENDLFGALPGSFWGVYGFLVHFGTFGHFGGF